MSAQSDQPALAQTTLEVALRLGEPEGYLRTFIDVGESLRHVLNAWLQHNHPGTPASLRIYASRLLSAFDRLSDKTSLENSAAVGLSETLTPRELSMFYTTSWQRAARTGRSPKG